MSSNKRRNRALEAKAKTRSDRTTAYRKRMSELTVVERMHKERIPLKGEPITPLRYYRFRDYDPQAYAGGYLVYKLEGKFYRCWVPDNVASELGVSSGASEETIRQEALREMKKHPQISMQQATLMAAQHLGASNPTTLKSHDVMEQCPRCHYSATWAMRSKLCPNCGYEGITWVKWDGNSWVEMTTKEMGEFANKYNLPTMEELEMNPSDYTPTELAKIAEIIYNADKRATTTIFDGRGIPIYVKWYQLTDREVNTMIDGLKTRIENEGLDGYFKRIRPRNPEVVNSMIDSIKSAGLWREG